MNDYLNQINVKGVLYTISGGAGSGVTPAEVQEMINQSISGMSGDTQIISGDVIELSQDVQNISGDVIVLSGDVSALESNLSGKTDTSAFTAHTSDATIHLTSGDVATQMSAYTYDRQTIDDKIISGGTFDPSQYYRKSETSGKTELDAAFSAITKTIEDNEQVVSEALNDLNDKKQDTLIAGDYITIDSANTISTSGLVTVEDNEVAPTPKILGYMKGDNYLSWGNYNPVITSYTDAAESMEIHWFGRSGDQENSLTIINEQGEIKEGSFSWFFEYNPSSPNDRVASSLSDDGYVTLEMTITSGDTFYNDNCFLKFNLKEGWRIMSMYSWNKTGYDKGISLTLYKGSYEGGQSSDVIENVILPELSQKLTKNVTGVNPIFVGGTEDNIKISVEMTTPSGETSISAATEVFGKRYLARAVDVRKYVESKIASGGTFDPTLYYKKSETSGKTEIQNALDDKQDVLSAGDYITIDSANTISTSGLVTVEDNEVEEYPVLTSDIYDPSAAKFNVTSYDDAADVFELIITGPTWEYFDVSNSRFVFINESGETTANIDGIYRFSTSGAVYPARIQEYVNLDLYEYHTTDKYNVHLKYSCKNGWRLKQFFLYLVSDYSAGVEFKTYQNYPALQSADAISENVYPALEKLTANKFDKDFTCNDPLLYEAAYKRFRIKTSNQNYNEISASTSATTNLARAYDVKTYVESKIASGITSGDVVDIVSGYSYSKDEIDGKVSGKVDTSDFIVVRDTVVDVVNAVNDINDDIVSLSGDSGTLKLSAFTNAEYDSTNKVINFYNLTGGTVASIDATEFIKDGMIEDVEIVTSGGTTYLKITFNTDAGLEEIDLDLSSIFDANNYYTKSEVYNKTEVNNIVSNKIQCLSEAEWEQTSGSTVPDTLYLIY